MRLTINYILNTLRSAIIPCNEMVNGNGTPVTLRCYEFILSPQISLENGIVTDNIYVHKNNYYTLLTKIQ